MFQPLIVIYRRGYFVLHHWGCTSMCSFRSLYIKNHNKPVRWLSTILYLFRTMRKLVYLLGIITQLSVPANSLKYLNLGEGGLSPFPSIIIQNQFYLADFTFCFRKNIFIQMKYTITNQCFLERKIVIFKKLI